MKFLLLLITFTVQIISIQAQEFNNAMPKVLSYELEGVSLINLDLYQKSKDHYPLSDDSKIALSLFKDYWQYSKIDTQVLNKKLYDHSQVVQNSFLNHEEFLRGCGLLEDGISNSFDSGEMMLSLVLNNFINNVVLTKGIFSNKGKKIKF
jgi:hypothetical protein